jgi:hypothetical protein
MKVFEELRELKDYLICNSELLSFAENRSNKIRYDPKIQRWWEQLQDHLIKQQALIHSRISLLENYEPFAANTHMQKECERELLKTDSLLGTAPDEKRDDLLATYAGTIDRQQRLMLERPKIDAPSGRFLLNFLST